VHQSEYEFYLADVLLG